MKTKQHPRIPCSTTGTNCDLIEVYEDELAVCITNHLKSELKPGEKVSFYRAGTTNSPKGKDRIFHFRVYRP